MVLSAYGGNSARTETHLSHLASQTGSPEDSVMTETLKQHINHQVVIKFGGEKYYSNRTQDITF